MKVVDFFKHLVDWVSEHIKKNGLQHTITTILLVILIIVFMTGYSDRIIKGVGQEFHDSKVEQFEDHQVLWMQSRELYAELKALMRKERAGTNADYILFIEYHNGNENIATGYSFCKFDVSISVRSDTVPVLPIEDFRDENIWTWDMLLTDEVIHRKMMAVSLERALEIDPGMIHRIHPNDHTQYVVFYNVEIEGITAGTLMFLYKSPNDVDWGAITTSGSQVEQTMVTAMRMRNKSNRSKSRK